ncbi:chloramphenicol acetyltransferase [uncultured Kiloniella sp.]|uniref:chloramphenicol acetyltransferase n=1 Tax=uncultured Kiloniella sp. TaxID=1133091 RepID=UPI00262FBE1D|nr:chloramphenicol acetyltransferase [uncultured Kiloniella sp.]
MYFQTQPHVKKQLSEHPTIADTAVVLDSHLGQWTEVGEGTKIVESRLDDYSYVVNNSDIIYSQIGKFVNIAAFVRLNPGQHPMDRASMHHFQYRSDAYDMGNDDVDFFDWRRSSPVRVDHDVWIGHGAIVKGGVHIGTGSVIGSAAVVTKDVAPYSIVAGVPATEIRSRFEKPIQKALLRIKWWDWGHDLIKDRLKDFRTLTIDEFCLKYDPEL